MTNEYEVNSIFQLDPPQCSIKITKEALNIGDAFVLLLETLQMAFQIIISYDMRC